MAPKKNRSPRLDKQLAGHIKWLWLNTPMNQAQISATLGAINQGRVSEVVNGKRYASVSPQKFEGFA
jgi:predicted XRE-type DNA-binding protein